MTQEIELSMLKLVRHLTSQRAQLLFGERSGIPPARIDALNDPFLVGEPSQSVAQARQIGRAY